MARARVRCSCKDKERGLSDEVGKCAIGKSLAFFFSFFLRGQTRRRSLTDDEVGVAAETPWLLKFSSNDAMVQGWC
jgi:hypothetical protein